MRIDITVVQTVQINYVIFTCVFKISLIWYNNDDDNINVNSFTSKLEQMTDLLRSVSPTPYYSRRRHLAGHGAPSPSF